MPFADATCHVLSHMAARGSQVFDVLRVVTTDDGPCAVGLRPHVARFINSAELMGMRDVGTAGDLERAVAETVMAAPAGNGRTRSFTVKLVAAWTEEAIGVMPASLQPTVYVLALPIDPATEPEVLGRPVKVKSVSMPKLPPSVLPPSLKVAASYTPGLREQMRVRSEGFDFPIFRTVNGDLAESTTLSVLVVADGRLLAPPLDSVLDGISRRIVVDVAGHQTIPVDVRGVYWDEVEGADELIFSSTTHVVTPVSLLDDRVIEAPGPVTKQIGVAMTELYQGNHPLSGRWLTPLSSLL